MKLLSLSLGYALTCIASSSGACCYTVCWLIQNLSITHQMLHSCSKVKNSGSIFKRGLLYMQTNFISNYFTKLSCGLLHVSANYYSCHQEALIKNTSNISYVSKYPSAGIRYAACFFVNITVPLRWLQYVVEKYRNAQLSFVQ